MSEIILGKSKIAIVGSSHFQDANKIREFIFKLKEKFGKKLTVIGGGSAKGVDAYSKKFALELGANYIEFPPANFPQTIYHGVQAGWEFKNYKMNKTLRNKLIATTASKCAVFISTDGNRPDELNDVIEKFKNLGKDVVIIN